MLGLVWRKADAPEGSGTGVLWTAEEIFSQYQNAMYGIAFSVLGDRWQAEDAVMDALTKICANIGRFQDLEESSVRLLVLRYTKNAALDRRRRENRIRAHEQLDEDELEENAVPAVGAEEEYLTREEMNGRDFGILNALVGRLDPKYRTVLELRYGEGLSYEEIAQALGISESTAASRISRAKIRLRTMYEEEKK